jgi:hypothetical protein
MKSALLILLLLFSFRAHAWTFIGNGGNAGDVELAVTHQQLATIFAEIPDRPADARGLCECTGEFDNHPMCDALKKLSPAQAKFCGEQLKIRSDEASRLNDRVRVQWTHDFVEVSESGRKRGADAAADRAADEITVNVDRFMELKSYEREFLLAHELFHFTSYDSKPLTDEGPIGPFEGNDGSRNFINAMSAAVVMESVDEGLISKYQRSLKRPQGWKHAWLSVDGGTSRNEKDLAGLFPNNEFSKSGANFRYHFSNGFGIMLSVRLLKASKSILTSTKIEESSQALGLGIAYRYFPFKDPLTFFGQSHRRKHLGEVLVQGRFQSVHGRLRDIDWREHRLQLLPSSFLGPLGLRWRKLRYSKLSVLESSRKI